jgi:hypothetical protein
MRCSVIQGFPRTVIELVHRVLNVFVRYVLKTAAFLQLAEIAYVQYYAI